MSGGYIKSLDGVRAIAIILVMTFHAELNHFGWLGVQLFFVLSGFLITGILWKEKGSAEPNGYKLRKFWYRRSLRIFPLYFGYLLFFGITYLLFHFPPYFGTYFPYLVSYTVNFSRTLPGWEGNPLFTHLWSLSIEEQFYLFFPFLIFFCPARFIRYFMLAVLLAAPLIRYGVGAYYLKEGYPPEVVADIVYWNTLSHLDAFFIGGLIPAWGLDRKIRRPGVLLLCAFLLAVVAGAWSFFTGTATHAYTTDLGYGHGRIAHYEHVWQYTLLNVFFAAFILNLVSPFAGRNVLQKLLERNWVVQVGRVSYGMYLFHWAVLVYAFRPLFGGAHWGFQLLLFLPYLAAVYSVAFLSFRLYESRFLKLKDAFFRTKKGSGPPAGTVGEEPSVPRIR